MATWIKFTNLSKFILLKRQKMDYKDTLFLPTTDFAMRGNLPQNEPKRLNLGMMNEKFMKK